MINLNTIGVNQNLVFQQPSQSTEKKLPQIDSRISQYQSLWQRATVTGALRESLNISSIQKESDIRDARIAMKIEHILFFDSDSKKQKKNRENDVKGKKKLKSLVQLLLLTQNNSQQSCRKTFFKITKNSKFKNLNTFEIKFAKQKAELSSANL